MEGRAGSKGDSRPESPASTGNDSVDLAQSSVRTPSPTHRIHGCISSALSVGGFSQTEGMSEKMRFKLEMRRMEPKEAGEVKRLEAER